MPDKQKKTPHWVIGKHAVLAFLQCKPQAVQTLFSIHSVESLAKGTTIDAALSAQIIQHNILLQHVHKSELASLCGHAQHQGIALEVREAVFGDEKDLLHFLRPVETPLILILDQIQDPHNFGACLRTADAAGVDAVVVAKDNSCPMTAVVRKVASGAAETMPVFQVTNLARTIDSIKQQGIWVMGTSDKAELSLYQQDLSLPLALILGSEGKGMRKLVSQKCDFLVSLPMSGKIVSSLNVSVSAGVCLYEARRQRNKLSG